MSRNNFVRILLLLLLLAVAAVGVGLSLSTGDYLTGGICIAVGVLAIGLVFYTINGINRKLGYFFRSLANEDFTIHFVEGKGMKSERFLNRMINKTKDILQKTRLEIQEKERFYELIIDSVSSGIVTVNEKGYVTQSNRVALNLLGLEVFTHIRQLERVSPVLYKSFQDMLPGESRQVTRSNERGNIQLLINASRIIIREQPVTLFVLNDIENEMDEKEIDSWIRLIRVLSHEMMNSIAPITSLSDTLLAMSRERSPEFSEEVWKENVNNGLQVISETGKGLISFVDSYRKFTRIPEPEKELIDLNEFFNRMIILNSTEPHFSHVGISMQIEPEDLKVYADPNLLGQVLINLMRNAFQALEGRDGGRIGLLAGRTESGSVFIQVRDNGPGIPAEILHEIFVPFFTSKEEGSGIGLSIARQIMRAHGGNIKVHSQPGEDTVFTLTL